MEGREWAALSVYRGEVSDDSGGPVEWCMPAPDAEAESLAARFPGLNLRTFASRGRSRTLSVARARRMGPPAGSGPTPSP